MHSLLLTGNDKRLCDTFVRVHATTKCKSDNKVEGLCQALELVLYKFCYYHLKTLLGAFSVETGGEISGNGHFQPSLHGITCNNGVRVVTFASPKCL